MSFLFLYNRYTMKKLISPVMLLAFFQLPQALPVTPSPGKEYVPAKNLIIITIDGFRWQEIFSGADSSLISNPRFTPDTSLMKLMYWASSSLERRRKLMPFLWNVLSKKGQLFGNRVYGNKVNVANNYVLSYPGYNEIFTGMPDPEIASNKKKRNHNPNVLDYLHQQPGFDGKIAAFTSWDVFPYIFHASENPFFINSGYASVDTEIPSQAFTLINEVQKDFIKEKQATRFDQLTFLAAKEYLQQYRPRVLFIGLGETDEAAHEGRYDLYLQHANQADKMIADLWYWVQTNPEYKDNTTFIITTDHGRGSKTNKWTSHGSFIGGSSQTWIAMAGPGIFPAGEIKVHEQQYQAQLAQTIARTVGEDFGKQRTIAAEVSLQ